ncbi:polysaccharide pyruvyl transferase family protein [Vulgatibacter sp.]|uniref:polysaccharide pyruvyl transferase family protein n=1 Tax=Vulgatibacter sp. TaxID=1971226 RepID=UPI0035653D5B
MNVAVINTVCLNTGDAAIAEALQASVREALGPCDFTVFDSNPEASARLYPGWRFRQSLTPLLQPRLPIRLPKGEAIARRLPPLRLRAAAALEAAGRGALAAPVLRAAEQEALRTWAASDLVVAHGGTYLVEHYELHARILEFELILALGKPLVLFTQSLGPFRKRLYRRRLRRIFERAALVLLRDERSLGHLRDLGVRSDRLHVVPDAVFALADDERLRAAEAAQLPAGERLRVAISVRDWPYIGEAMERYEAGIGALATHVVDRLGGEVIFVSTCQGVADYWTDDSRTAVRIAERLPAHVRASVEVDRGFHDRRALGALFASCDLVVATRMHAAILALCAGVPVLPIAYEFKTEEVFRSLGMGAFVTRIDEVQGGVLVERFDALREALPRLRGPFFREVLATAARARGTAARIRAAVEGAPR